MRNNGPRRQTVLDDEAGRRDSYSFPLGSSRGDAYEYMMDSVFFYLFRVCLLHGGRSGT